GVGRAGPCPEFGRGGRVCGVRGGDRGATGPGGTEPGRAGACRSAPGGQVRLRRVEPEALAAGDSPVRVMRRVTVCDQPQVFLKTPPYRRRTAAGGPAEILSPPAKYHCNYLADLLKDSRCPGPNVNGTRARHRRGPALTNGRCAREATGTRRRARRARPRGAAARPSRRLVR